MRWKRSFAAFSLIFFSTVSAWNLESSNTKTNISKVSVIGSRAFACVRRRWRGQLATVVEIAWPERDDEDFPARPYPNIQSQILGDCEKLQSAVALETDSKYRLYVLDVGYGSCQPKVVIYDTRSNKEIITLELRGVPSRNLSSMVVYNGPDGDVKIYVGDVGSNSLLVLNPKESAWWTVGLNLSPSPVMESDSISYPNLADGLRTDQLSICKRDGTLYASSAKTLAVFSLDLKEFGEDPLKMNCNNFGENLAEIPVKYEGFKLGPSSSGIFVDARCGLNYVYDDDYVALRWDTRLKNMGPENTSLVRQSRLLTGVIQMLTDQYQQLWAIRGRVGENRPQSVKIKNVYALP